MSAITDNIRSKGHWDVVIKPQTFDENRVRYADLEKIINASVVSLRGWPVPYIDYRTPVIHREDWIGQDEESQVVPHREAWRFFTSGQFNHLRAVSADWRTGRDATPVPYGFLSVIEVWEILFYVTEVFELAARLALTDAGAETMSIEITLNRLLDRALVLNFPRRIPLDPRRTDIENLPNTVSLPRSELVGEPRQHAAQFAYEIFVRFGWDPTLAQLTELQSELGR